MNNHKRWINTEVFNDKLRLMYYTCFTRGLFRYISH